MARWLVQLEGALYDLDEYAFWFPNGSVFAIQEKGEFFLAGPDLEACSTPDDVLKTARHALDRFTAVILLLSASLRKPTACQVFREEDDGTRNGMIFVTGSAAGRSKARGVLSPQLPNQLTSAQTLLAKAAGKPHLEEALSVWADPVRTWPRLYRDGRLPP